MRREEPDSTPRRIVSGVQPTGRLHLGNYYGAVRQFLELAEEGRGLHFVADLHSLTTVRDAPRRRALVREAAAGLLALGLDPARMALFRQSDVPEISELLWILGSVVPMAQLERAHAYKDKVAAGARPDFGLFAYPVLMAADMLALDAELVPVGRDQAQHVELARDWATRFNLVYVPGYDPADPTGALGSPAGALGLPEARFPAAASLVPGIDGRKMSKSYRNTIDLFAEDHEIEARILAIRTDSTPIDAPKPTRGSPLFDLLSLVAKEPERAAIEAEWRAGGAGYGRYKRLLLEHFHATFGPARARYAELTREPGELERTLDRGAREAREIAAAVVDRARRAAGLR